MPFSDEHKHNALIDNYINLKNTVYSECIFWYFTYCRSATCLILPIFLATSVHHFVE